MCLGEGPLLILTLAFAVGIATGVYVSLPRSHHRGDHHSGTRRPGRPRGLHIVYAQIGNGSSPTGLVLVVDYEKGAPALDYGNRISVSGRLQQPKGASNSSEFRLCRVPGTAGDVRHEPARRSWPACSSVAPGASPMTCRSLTRHRGLRYPTYMFCAQSGKPRYRLNGLRLGFLGISPRPRLLTKYPGGLPRRAGLMLSCYGWFLLDLPRGYERWPGGELSPGGD